MPHSRHIRKFVASTKDLIAHTVRRIKIVIGDVVPNLLDIAKGLRRKLELAHRGALLFAPASFAFFSKLL